MDSSPHTGMWGCGQQQFPIGQPATTGTGHMRDGCVSNTFGSLITSGPLCRSVEIKLLHEKKGKQGFPYAAPPQEFQKLICVGDLT